MTWMVFQKILAYAMLPAFVFALTAPQSADALPPADFVVGCTSEADDTCEFVCVPGTALVVFFDGSGTVDGYCPGSPETEPPIPNAYATCSTSNGHCTASDEIQLLALGTCVGNGDGSFGCSSAVGPI